MKSERFVLSLRIETIDESGSIVLGMKTRMVFGIQ